MDWCEFKNSIKHRIYKEHYVWNSSTCACEINKYLKSIVHDLAIACNEIIDMSIIVSVNLNNKKSNMKNAWLWWFTHFFVSDHISKKTVTACYYCIKHRPKQNGMLMI